MATRRRFRSSRRRTKKPPAHRTCGLIAAARAVTSPSFFWIILGDYRGIVMSDGYTAWRTLEGATHIGCMAHSRRRFVDALKARKKGGGPPEQALRFFEHLYRVERQARDEKPDRGERQVNAFAASVSNIASPS